MRIALVANEYPPEPHGGIGTFTQVYARALVAAGHQVSVVGIAQINSTRDDRGVEVVRLRQSNTRGIAGCLNRRRISAWLEAREFDIIECPEFQGMLPYGVRGRPIVIRLHLSATLIARRAGERENVAVRWAERRTLQRTLNWIGGSQYASELTVECFGISPERTRIVGYPIVPSRRALALSASPPVVLFAGRVSERKGALRVARAAIHFMREVPEARLVYVGDEDVVAGEPIRTHISRIIGPQQIHRVEFRGRLAPEALRDVMSASSVFAFPSSLETFGLVVAEAMAEARAVVVPDTPPFTEFVADGETGRCLPLDDDARWGATITELLLNRRVANDIGLRARAHIENNFSIESCVSGSLDFYREVIRSGALEHATPSPGGCVRKFKEIALSAAPNLYTAAWWLFGNYPRKARRVARHLGYTVATGPFQGMKYPSVKTASRVLPKLVGSYEEELGAVVENIAAGGVPLVINVGCAEGYYAVGLALRLRGARIIAFDSDDRMRSRCRELARANAVPDDRLEIRGACDPAALAALPLAGSLIVMDCEGYERELLLGPDVTQFACTSILVETHDFLKFGTADEIARRFSDTHEVERFTSRERRPLEYAATEGLPAALRLMAVDEERGLVGRGVVQEWLWMRPRGYAQRIDV